MNDPDFEMEERLRHFAASTRTPPLPDETAALPWTVQDQKRRHGPAGWLAALAGVPRFAGRATYATARVAATVVVGAGLLVMIGQARGGGSAGAIAQPPMSTPAPIVGVPTGPEVVVLPTSGVVDDLMASYIKEGVQRAENDGAAAVVIQLDTLGGAEDSMMKIVQSLHARIPTIVWVGPSGAKAASAGTFITLAANLDYMAQSTNIGAASPVAAGGGDISRTYGDTEAAKVMNDAVATIRSIAQDRHPQAVDWAATTVAAARSYTATEALDAHGINGIANSLDDVLAQADGQTVTVNGAPVVVHTKGASIVTVGEDPIQGVLHGLDDPNIAFILLVIGVLCLAVELFHPTLFVGLAGTLALVLSFYGSGSLPLNILGVALVVLGIAMLILEPSVPSHGLLTIGGIAAFVVGAAAFYGSPGPYLPASQVAWPVIAAMAGAATAYGLVLIRSILEMRRQPAPVGLGLVGATEVVGLSGTVEMDLSPAGTVYVSKESWSARLQDGGRLSRGSHVKVVARQGLTLIVKPEE
jgi:membrane-bound serine protease (ClpP class)